MMKRLLPLITFAAFLPTLACAETQGLLGNSSTGSFAVTLNVAAIPSTAQIQITGLDDKTFGTTQGVPPSSSGDRFCVYMSEAGAYNFNVTAEPLSSTDFSGNVPYLFNLRDNISNEVKVGSVTDQNVTISGTGYTPSLVEGCAGETLPVSLGFAFEDTFAFSDAGSASTTITIIVAPD